MAARCPGLWPPQTGTHSRAVCVIRLRWRHHCRDCQGSKRFSHSLQLQAGHWTRCRGASAPHSCPRGPGGELCPLSSNTLSQMLSSWPLNSLSPESTSEPSPEWIVLFYGPITGIYFLWGQKKFSHYCSQRDGPPSLLLLCSCKELSKKSSLRARGSHLLLLSGPGCVPD